MRRGTRQECAGLSTNGEWSGEAGAGVHEEMEGR